MKISNYLAIIVCGICLGVLTGLSLSPVIQSIITSLITIIVAVLTLTAGLQEPAIQPASTFVARLKLINIWPTALFVLFFMLGSLTGVRLRATNAIGYNEKDQFAAMKHLGMSNEEIREVFKQRLLSKTEKTTDAAIEQSVLFVSETAGPLDMLRLKKGKELEAELRALANPAIDSFVSVSNDSLCLEAFKNFLLCSQK